MQADVGNGDRDADLLARYAAGEGAAARALLDRLAPRVLALATRLLADRAEAEDVTQEAMVRLWRMAPAWQPGRAQVATWLHRVTVNLCTDRLRRRGRLGVPEPRDDLPDVADSGPGALERLVGRDRLAALDAALRDLPDRQRLVVVLRDLEGMPNPEIADRLGLSVDAVESLAARGRRGLKARLSAQRTALGFADEDV